MWRSLGRLPIVQYARILARGTGGGFGLVGEPAWCRYTTTGSWKGIKGTKGKSLRSVDIDNWSASTMAEAVAHVPQNILGGKEDRYGGFIVDAKALPDDLAVFCPTLKDSLQYWGDMGKRAIWLKIPLKLARYVGPSVDEFQFVFHHARESYVMLVKWLPGGPNNLPPPASHQVGVGAFILNDDKEILAVQERSGPLKGKGVWKLPTGLVNAGEDIADGVEREVMEETGVEAKFQAIIAIRQGHGFLFGSSDMFFVCALKLVSSPETITFQESELVGAQWMPLDDFVGQEIMKNSLTLKSFLERCTAFSEGKYPGIMGQQIVDKMLKREYFVMWCEEPKTVESNKVDGAESKL